MTGARRGNVSTREHLSICDKPLGTWLGRAVFMTLQYNLQPSLTNNVSRKLFIFPFFQSNVMLYVCQTFIALNTSKLVKDR